MDLFNSKNCIFCDSLLTADGRYDIIGCERCPLKREFPTSIISKFEVSLANTNGSYCGIVIDKFLFEIIKSSDEMKIFTSSEGYWNFYKTIQFNYANFNNERLLAKLNGLANSIKLFA